jgi:signal transduction histidine kinase
MTDKPSFPSLEILRSTLKSLQGTNLPEGARMTVSESMEQLSKVEVEMENLVQAAQEANQARAKFVSVVTHELRLPLTSIKGYTDLLRQGIVGGVNDQQKNFLSIIRNNVERMSALISDLSDLSHIQSGRLKLQPKRTTVQAVIEEAMNSSKSKFEEKNQILEVQLPVETIDLEVDQGRLVQVINYLLSNANKYTPPDGKVLLSGFRSEDAVRIEITDTGIGISADDQARLFSAFFRSEDEAVREHPGWGLALHVARLLVELMDGEIGAKSEFRKGSTFWLSIPRGIEG